MTPRRALGCTLRDLLPDGSAPAASDGVSRLFVATEREADRYSSRADEIHVDPTIEPMPADWEAP